LYIAGPNRFEEVPFVFDNTEGVGYAELAGIDPYKKLAGLMASMWSSFITTLDPNISGGMSVPLLIEYEIESSANCTDAMFLQLLGSNLSWPTYGSFLGQNYVFDATITSLAYVERDTWRVEAINYFTQNFVELFGR
jgi:hypothetical protein